MKRCTGVYPNVLRNDTPKAWEKHGNLLIASNASVKHMHESPHFHHHGSGSFLLVEAPPQSPQDTILYPGNAAKCSGYAIFQITYGRLTSFFFGFSFHGKRILPQNPVYICLGSLQRTHLLSGLLVIRIQSFFLGQKLSIFCLQTLDSGQLFSPCPSKNCFAALCRIISDSCSERNFLE